MKLASLVKLFNGQTQYKSIELVYLVTDTGLIEKIKSNPAAIFVSNDIICALKSDIRRALMTLFYCIEYGLIPKNVVKIASEIELAPLHSLEKKSCLIRSCSEKEGGFVIYKDPNDDEKLVAVCIYGKSET